MDVVLGPNRYGKAETRVVRVTRDGTAHHLRDLNVSIALSGDMEAVHLAGDDSAVLPTDSQKNTVFAFAKKYGIGEIEEYGWERIRGGHSFVRHRDVEADFRNSFREARRCLLEAFAGTHSLSLQQTLYEMGRKVLEERAEICEIRLSMPNKHHFLVDLEPFGMDNDNEVYFAADRPYGLIEGGVRTAEAPDDTAAWS